MSPNVRAVPALPGWVKCHGILATVLMSTILAAALCCLHTAAQEPPSAAEQPESPLDQKITLKIKVSSLADLCELLTEVSGVEFAARGSAGDRKVTIFARDRRLGEVAEGVAEVSHLYFGWVKEGSKKGRYVFYEDDKHKAEREAKIEEEQRQKAEKRERETRWMLDTYFAALDLPPDSPEWDRIKKESPWVWLALVKNEFGQRQAVEFIRGLPKAALDGLCRGTRYKARFGDLGARAQELVEDAVGLESFGAIGFSERNLREAGVEVWAGATGIEVYARNPDAGGAAGSTVMWPREMDLDTALEIVADEEPDDEMRAELYKLAETHRGEREAERRQISEQERSRLLVRYRDNPFLMKEGPWPSKDIKAVERRALPNLLEMISRESGLSVYAEYFTRRPVPTRVAREVPLWEYLWHVQDTYRIEWDAQDAVLKVTYRDWYDRLGPETPEPLLARWRRRVEETGRLDLSDLLDICRSLSKEQATALREDVTLSGPATPIRSGPNYDTLRFLAALNPQQMDSARTFLRLADLSSSQAQGFLELAQSVNRRDAVQIDPQWAGLSIATRPLGENSWRSDPRTELVTITFVWSEGKEHKRELYVRPPKEDAEEVQRVNEARERNSRRVDLS